MKEVVLDLAGCRDETDFDVAARKALGAPDWHGWGLDPWWDSICGDEVNAVRSPYRVTLRGVGNLSPALRHYVEQFAALFAEASDAHGLPVSAVIET